MTHLFAPIALALLQAAPQRVLLGREGAGFAETIDGQLVLHVKGTPYEMGLQHGRLLKPRVAECVRSYLDESELAAGKRTLDDLIGVCKEAEPGSPDDYKEQLRGGVRDG